MNTSPANRPKARKLLARRGKRAGLAIRPVAPSRDDCSCELLILPDGSLITHNLTPAVAALLKDVLHV